MLRIVFVEDTYGKEFHMAIMRKLRENDELDPSVGIRVDSRPVRKCDAKLRRIVLSRPEVIEGERVKVLFVIDSEGKPNAEDVVLMHFSDLPDNVFVRVVTVNPMHEAWLCIGLGGDKRVCRQDPVGALSRLRGDYEKRYLGEWASRVDIGNLMPEQDFGEYLSALRWLVQDP
jgi:hypothetical protein